jgi:HNH endonuclease
MVPRRITGRSKRLSLPIPSLSYLYRKLILMKDKEPPFKCLYCLKDKSSTTTFDSVEHVVPESLGNKNYILPQGFVCDKCQNYFSHIENKVLNSVPFSWERSISSTLTKKNKYPRLERSGIKLETRDNRPHLDIDRPNLKKNDYRVDKTTGLINLHIPEQDNQKTLNRNYLRFLIKMGLGLLFFNTNDSQFKYNHLLNPYSSSFNEGRDFARQPPRGATWNLWTGILGQESWLSSGQYKAKLDLSHNSTIFRFRYGFYACACNLVKPELDNHLSTLEEGLILQSSVLHKVTM